MYYSPLKTGPVKSPCYKANKSASAAKHLAGQFASIIQEHKLHH